MNSVRLLSHSSWAAVCEEKLTWIFCCRFVVREIEVCRRLLQDGFGQPRRQKLILFPQGWETRDVEAGHQFYAVSPCHCCP